LQSCSQEKGGNVASPNMLRFGAFEVDVRAGELRKHGSRIRLQRQPFQVLSILLEHPGDVVLRDQLRQRLWPNDIFVDFDHSLNRSINKLRVALGDSLESPRFIETLPGRGYRFLARVEGGVGGTQAQPRRIAVLAIENSTGNPENDYLADGVTGALIESLGRSLAGRVRVTALASVLRLRKLALPISQVAKELAVDMIIAGRLRRAGEGLGIRLELIDAKDEASIWVKSCDLRCGFECGGVNCGLCDQICAAVASVSDPDARATTPVCAVRERACIEAQQAYLRGRYFWSQRTESNVKRAIEYFRYAIEKDPNYPLPYVGLAESYIVLTSWGYVHPCEASSIARESALKALAIAPDFSEAHVALGWSRLVLDWDWASAEQEFQTAISLNSSNALAYHWYAYFLMARGAVAESLDLNRRALDIDPLSVPVNCIRGWLLYCAGRYEEAVAQCRRTCELECSHPGPHAYLAMAYEQLGRYEEAIAEFTQAVSATNGASITRMLLAHAYAVAGYAERARDLLGALEELGSTTYLCGYYMAAIYAALEMRDKAFAWLEKSCEDHEVWTLYLGIDPRFAGLRSDKRFLEILDSLPLRAPEAPMRASA
jgi:DNA-binding winged helix-turn-helix (wHTH) protein/tetratricopeptide (TPR) repeat protein